jgi:hypothetical protein
VDHNLLAALIGAFALVLVAVIPVMLSRITRAVKNGKQATLASVDARLSLVDEHVDAAIRQHERDVEDLRRRIERLENHRLPG